MSEPLPTSVDQMKDILDIEDVMTSPWAGYLRTAFWSLLAVVLLVVFCALIYRLYRWFKKRRDERNLSPSQRAKRALSTLAKVGYLQSAHFAEYYFSLTEIFKTYLEAALHREALEKTDADLKTEAESLADLANMSATKLKEFLTRAELAKFAKQTFLIGEGEADLVFVSEFVDATAIKKEPLSSQKGAK